MDAIQAISNNPLELRPDLSTQNLSSSASNTSRISNNIQTTDSVKIDVNDIYSYFRSEVSMDLKNINDGLTISDLALESLEAEQKFLDDMYQKIEDFKRNENSTNEDFDKLSKKLQKDLQDIANISQRTIFNGQQLISTLNEENKIIQIPTPDKPVVIDIPSTNDIATNLYSKVVSGKFDVSSLDDFVSEIKKSKVEIDKYKRDFVEAKEELVNKAKDIITKEEINSIKQKANYMQTTKLNEVDPTIISGMLAMVHPITTQDRAMALLK